MTENRSVVAWSKFGGMGILEKGIDYKEHKGTFGGNGNVLNHDFMLINSSKGILKIGTFYYM